MAAIDVRPEHPVKSVAILATVLAFALQGGAWAQGQSSRYTDATACSPLINAVLEQGCREASEPVSSLSKATKDRTAAKTTSGDTADPTNDGSSGGTGAVAGGAGNTNSGSLGNTSGAGAEPTDNTGSTQTGDTKSKGGKKGDNGSGNGGGDGSPNGRDDSGR